MAKKRKVQQETVVVELTEEERSERAFTLAEKSSQLLKVKTAKTAAAKDFTAQIKELEESIRELADAFSTGRERRPAQVDWTEDNGQVLAMQ